MPSVTGTRRRPDEQYLAPEFVLDEMAAHGARRVRQLSPDRIFILALLGGAFITIGALFSALLAAGAPYPGLERLLEGVGFSSGFFFVILSHAALFTEANVVMPATLLGSSRHVAAARVARFWVVALIGNFVGALLVGWVIVRVQSYPPDVSDVVAAVVERKLDFFNRGTASAWLQAVASGMLANWLVGMAAFFSVMGRTIIGKYIPVLLAVMVFVAANFQHSPANMGFFALADLAGGHPGWRSVVVWNLLPAGLGNLLGGTLLVALPLWHALRRGEPGA